MQVRTTREIGALVRTRREEAGLTQVRLADLAHVSREWIVSLEAGKSSVRLDKVLDVLNVLGLKLIMEGK